LITKILIDILKKPTIQYPIIVIFIFSLLRMFNYFIESILGYQIFGPISIGIIVGYIFGKMIESERKTYKLAITDSLTGLHNRTGFDSKLDFYFSTLKTNDSISVISIDIDDFKIINDDYGHAMGDIALSIIGKIIKKNTRLTDSAARCGGDEFTIFLPQANYKVAMRIAKAIKKEVNETPINTSKDESVMLNISIGIATSNTSNLSKDELLKLSDKQMYDSKSLGKNRISGLEVD